jgi:membrane protein required for colicin V production
VDPVQLIDIVVLAVLAIAAMVGLVKGLVRQVIELVGIVAAFVLATIFAGWLAEALRLHTPLPYSPSLVVAFVLLLIGGIIASHFIALMVQKLIRMTFLGWFDRLCGAALGLVVGAVLASLLVSVTLELPVSGRARGHIRSSQACQFVQPIAPTIFNAILSRVPGRLSFDNIFRRGDRA